MLKLTTITGGNNEADRNEVATGQQRVKLNTEVHESMLKRLEEPVESQVAYESETDEKEESIFNRSKGVGDKGQFSTVVAVIDDKTVAEADEEKKDQSFKTDKVEPKRNEHGNLLTFGEQTFLTL